VAIATATPAVKAAAGAGTFVAYQGEASALAVEISETIPGGPGTDTIIDGGGPTTQAAGNNFSPGNGYASFPDPGRFAAGAPGLMAGLFSSGAAGLPPLALPSLSYPMSIQSSATKPDAHAGSGPFVLRTSSTETATTAEATAGFRPSGIGNAALAAAESTVTHSPDGTVVSAATSSLQGLSFGPLTIGEIVSRATETLDPRTGLVTPASSIEINGMQIGGVPVSINGSSINMFGAENVPIPIDDSLNKILASGGVSITTAGSKQGQGSISAPAITIHGPIPLLDSFKIGTGQPTFAMTIGGATAALLGSSNPQTATVSATNDTTLPSAGNSATPAGGVQVSGSGAALPVTAPILGAVPSGNTASAPGAAQAQPVVSFLPATQTAALEQQRPFNVRSTYLMLPMLCLIAFGIVAALRVLGVKGRWTSTSG
jgi:hypothetical protein